MRIRKESSTFISVNQKTPRKNKAERKENKSYQQEK
jgi:hypothetical protein